MNAERLQQLRHLFNIRRVLLAIVHPSQSNSSTIDSDHIVGNKYYTVKSGDSCAGIVSAYNNAFTLAQLFVNIIHKHELSSKIYSYARNPAVGNTLPTSPFWQYTGTNHGVYDNFGILGQFRKGAQYI